MNENLIHYISKLSTVIVIEQFENDKNFKRYHEKFFDFYVGLLRKKGFEVLLRKIEGTPLSDPCVTNYGGNWSPVTLITDYGRELISQGHGKANDNLLKSISVLMEKDYICVNELLKLLLLLKRPLDKEPLQQLQSDLSFSSSDFPLNIKDSDSYITEAWSGESISEASFFKKRLHYEEMWMKHFDSKFRILGEFSRKNCQGSENVSLHSLEHSVKNPAQNRSSCFVFTDFLQERDRKDEKSWLFLQDCDLENENPLLDSLVDNPIQHKLPSQKHPSKLSFTLSHLNWSDSCADSRSNEKANVIALKRDPNCSHSFSILYKKTSTIEHSSSFESNSSCNFKSKDNKEKKSCSSFSSSKDLVLGLWEKEASLIKEFKPELASSFPDLRMISMEEFISDIKYLLTGINSGTFEWNFMQREFHMLYGTCLNDVTPESLYYFSRDLIDIGNSYVKLTCRLAEMGVHNLPCSTTIFQAFWKSIFDFLELYYARILEIPLHINLLLLKSYLGDTYEMITTVAKICMTDQPVKDFPQGGELLSYLVRIAEQTCKQSVTNIVFGILKNCCSVYFSYILENWMFKGELETNQNEFFVGCHSQKVNIKSRAYYSSFFLNQKKVPSFLKGIENSIYHCGKSIHFLKLFNSEDKLCKILNKTDYPSMRICLSDKQIEELEKEFKAYEERVLQSCGGKTTIKTIKEEEKEKEKAHVEFIKECRKITAEQQKEARQRALIANKAKKEKQNQELNEQKKRIEEEKKRKKEKEQAEELKLQKEIEKNNSTKENLINEEKNLMLLQYNNLFEALDRRMIVAEKRKEKLKEIINDNHTDKEGNLTNQVDINSNEETVEEIFWKEGTGSDEYDENLNPSLSTPEIEMSKIRYITAAAEEAARNKIKILQTEYFFQAEPPSEILETKSKEVMTDLERNKRKLWETEYNITLKPDLNHFLLKTTSGVLELPKNNKKTDCKTENESSEFALKKPKCLNITQKVSESDPLKKTFSRNSEFSGEISFENLPQACQNSSKTSLFLSDYQEGLARDSDIVFSRPSNHDIFCKLRKKEIEHLPCENYYAFLKFLRQSAYIPLKVQERLANDALLKHLLKEENLLSHLNSLRGYFFLNDGEFGRSFTHHTFRSLAKCTEPSQFFEKSNLNNIVNEALNYTIHNLEPNSQNLSFRIRKMPPFLNHSSHDVLAPFELTYKVAWPLNIILTDKALSKYKMVFRFLLKLKRISWTLNENFSYFNWQFKSNRLNGKTLVRSSHFHKIQIYRHAMTQIIITIDDYIFSNGIQLPWIEFLKALETTKNIDDLYQKHVGYIKDVLTGCFLSKDSEELLNCILSLLELSLKFHYTSKSSRLVYTNETYTHPKYLVLKETFNEFSFVLKTFLKILKQKLHSNEVVRSHYLLIEKFDQKIT